MSLRMADMDPKSEAYKALGERYEMNFKTAYERYGRVSNELPSRADAMKELVGFVGELKDNLDQMLAAAAAAIRRRSLNCRACMKSSSASSLRSAAITIRPCRLC